MASTPSVDLNADMGESFGRWRLGDDEGLLNVVSSANVACGFHAGDSATLLRTCRAAVGNGVSIGAQVGYNDLQGFGRRFIDMEPEHLYADVLYQIGALDGIARSVGGQVSYVKPHGALYNAVVHHQEQAEAVAQAVVDYDKSLPLLGLPGSELLAVADGMGLTTVREAFADRAYTPEGRLVSRREADAVIHDPAVVARRVLELVTEGRLSAVDGSTVDLEAQSVCVHGDSPGAVAIASAVREALDDAGVEIAPFAP